ncbi:MAG TPA: S8 family peptidase [Thermoanaerobaculia bacterium]
MAPQFSDLEHIFTAKLAQLQNDPAGVLPEQTLVLETVGRVKDFYKAVRQIRGLEWMGEFDIEDIVPDEDFYDERAVEAGLPGRVYLILHNQEGLDQILALWETFRRNPEHPQFARGRAKFRDLFRQLRALRPWGHEDRLRETGLLEDWQERVAAGQEVMRIELELWPRTRSWERPRVESWVSTLIEREGGRVLARCAVESIAYHALLAELPIQAVQRILEDSAVELGRCEQVMFFRPVGQVLVELPDREPEDVSLQAQNLGETPAGEPIAALLDGLPLANHEWLAGRLIIDDPDRWEDQYPANVRHHGTAMASLILHSELDAPAVPLSRPLYVRPVMKPHPQDPKRETIPPDCLTVDLIQRAVLRMLKRDGAEPPAAPSVRIINLSLADRARPFDRYPSPWARLLDDLAVQYNVLFVVSAGNHPHRIELSVPRSELESLLTDPETLVGETLRAVRDDNRHRRLLSPAEAINALTVGALHSDASPQSPLPPDGIDPLAGMALPAFYNAQGLGFRRAVKPEVFFAGGRLLYRRTYGSDQVSLESIDSGRPPGQKVAAPGVSPGELSGVRYIRGTSNAAALVTRVACQLHDVLDELRSTSEGPAPEDEDLAILIRALLVHGSCWGDSQAVLEGHLGAHRGDPEFSRICGFGDLDAARVLACTDQRVTLLGWGAIQKRQAFAYDLPLPPSLSGERFLRRLVTTVAWFSPIHPRHHRYRRAHVWLTRYGGQRRDEEAMTRLGLHRAGAEQYLARRGTVQHEVYEGERAVTYGEDEALTFQVNCRSDAGELERYVRYGLAITLEVPESTGLSIYEEIRTRIRPPIAPPITP